MSASRWARSMVCVLVVLTVAGVAMAQTSASYKLTEFTFNNGGDPRNGSSAASASYKIRLDAIGDAIVATALSSGSHHMDVGFVGDYAPPQEVNNARFTDKSTLVWDPEKSVGSYDLYGASLSTLSGLGFGTCVQNGLTAESATGLPSPSTGQGTFYLVTARNRLGEIGTKGFPTSGIERANAAPCP